MKAAIIVNPTAARGALGKRWPTITKVLKAENFKFEAFFTAYQRHGSELARQAVEAGFDLIVAAGGDGTMNDVVNGLIADGQAVNPAVSLGIISAGTGADFARTVGIPRDPAASARHLARSNSSRMIDVGEVEARLDAEVVRRYFVNVAGLGFAAEVVERTESGGKRGSGTIPYLTALATTIFKYRNKAVRLRVDDQSWQGTINSVVICNGQYFGGGMRVGPGARPDDGQFEVVTVGAFTPLSFLWNTIKLYRGTHLGLKQVSLRQGQRVRIESPQRLSIQADGELMGTCPATLRLLPGILRVRV